MTAEEENLQNDQILINFDQLPPLKWTIVNISHTYPLITWPSLDAYPPLLFHLVIECPPRGLLQRSDYWRGEPPKRRGEQGYIGFINHDGGIVCSLCSFSWIPHLRSFKLLWKVSPCGVGLENWPCNSRVRPVFDPWYWHFEKGVYLDENCWTHTQKKPLFRWPSSQSWRQVTMSAVVCLV